MGDAGDLGEVGTVEGFEAFVSEHADDLLRLAFVLTGSRADSQDVVQESLLKMLRHWERVCRAGDLGAYARRSVVNTTRSWWRKNRSREVPWPEVPRSDDPAMARGMSPDDLVVWRACLALPGAQRVAVVLRFYEGLSYAEIGELAGCSEGAARARTHRALQGLRRSLGGEAR